MQYPVIRLICCKQLDISWLFKSMVWYASLHKSKQQIHETMTA